MLRELGAIARRRNLRAINMPFIKTSKNLPARQFLDSVASQYRQEIGGGMLYRLPADVATEVVYDPSSLTPPPTDDSTARPVLNQQGKSGELQSRRYERIASDLTSADAILAHVHSRTGRQRARPDLPQPVVLPRTDVERSLVEIWMEVLNLDQVGVEDNYFALGGSSLLAVDLFARIETKFGKKLPLTSLIQAPTAAELARVIVNTTCRETLVRLAEGGNGPPLFLIHDGDGETMLYRNLAVRLKDERSVFGLQPLAMNNVPMVHTQISEMAAYHVDTIRSVQPHGPYCLGGMCAGGVIAFEIARQLQDRGEFVSMVALLDAADPTARPRAWRFASQRLQRFSTAFRSDKRPASHELALTALKKVKNFGVYLLQDRWIKLRDEIRMRLFQFCIRRQLPLPRALQQIPVRTVYLFAEKNYRADKPFDGQLLLCRATVGEGDDEPYINRFSDPLLGWSLRASRGVQVVDIPGGHSSMLQEPNVGALADSLRSRFQKPSAFRFLPDRPYTERAHAAGAVSTVG